MMNPPRSQPTQNPKLKTQNCKFSRRRFLASSGLLAMATLMPGCKTTGGAVIAEQKFGVECDSPEMQKIYQLAAHYHVPVLMHWQVKMYNYGFERFHKMLKKHPKTIFLGHAQTWWANIDKNYKDDPSNL